MADEVDPERVHAIGEIVAAIIKATEGKTVGDAQIAMANAICRMAVSINPEDPDRIVLLTIEHISEVWRAYRLRWKEGLSLDHILDGGTLN